MMEEKKENTILAFTEWVDKQGDKYLLLVGEEDNSIMALKSGERDEVANYLANGMIQHEELKDIIAKALMIWYIKSRSGHYGEEG